MVDAPALMSPSALTSWEAPPDQENEDHTTCAIIKNLLAYLELGQLNLCHCLHLTRAWPHPSRLVAALLSVVRHPSRGGILEGGNDTRGEWEPLKVSLTRTSTGIKIKLHMNEGQRVLFGGEVSFVLQKNIPWWQNMMYRKAHQFPFGTIYGI